MRGVLDTCILKLATFPGENNLSALIFELARAGLIELWVSPAILTEYSDVLGDHPEFVAEIISISRVCHSLTELSVIRQSPIIDSWNARWSRTQTSTVNTASGHFDQTKYQEVRVLRPGEFLNSSAWLSNSRNNDRVLTEAAISGKIDYLRGPKENVTMGQRGGRPPNGSRHPPAR